MHYYLLILFIRQCDHYRLYFTIETINHDHIVETSTTCDHNIHSIYVAIFSINLSFPLHADVEISFEVNELEKAQALNPSWKMEKG